MSSKRTTLLSLFLAVAVGVAACGGKEEREAEFLARGKEFYEQGDYTKAALEFRNALQINPARVDGQLYLGLIAEQTGDLSAAYGAFNRVVEQDPKQVTAQLKLGQYALLQDQRDKALQKADLVLSMTPDDPEARALRAAALLRQGKTAEAEAEAQRALKLSPTLASAIAVVAGIRAKEGNIDAALKLLDDGIKAQPTDDGLKLVKLKILSDRNDIAGSEGILRDLVATSPANNGYKINLAQLLLAQNKPGEAEKVFRDGIAQRPEDTDLKLILVEFISQVRGREAAEKELLAFAAAAPEEYDYQFALADLYVGQSKLAEAEAKLSEISGKVSSGPVALRAKTKLAELQWQRGDAAKATALVDEVLKADSDNTDALLLRAGMLMKARNFQSAIADLRTVLRDNPGSKQALLLLARTYSATGEQELATDAYQTYLDIDPINDEIGMEFARRLLVLGERDEARKQVDTILKRSPKYKPALLLGLDLQLMARDYSGARETARWLLNGTDDKTAAHAAEGKILLAEGKYPEAITALQAATAAQPGPSEARALLVQALGAEGRGDEAVTLLEAALAKEPGDADAMLLLADTQYNQDQPEKAAQALQDAMKVQPAWQRLYINLGDLYSRNGEMDQAIATYRRGLTTTPDNPALLLNLGMAEDARDNYDAARQAYEAVLRLQPRNTLAANNLAALIADAWPEDKDKMEQARRLAEPFRNSSNPLLLDTLGWIQFRLGNLDDATGILERAVKGMPGQPQLRYHLGMSYRALGEQTKAREQLQEALSGAQEFRGVEDARRTLDLL